MPNGNQPVRSLDSGTVGQVLVTGADTYPAWVDRGTFAYKARGVCYSNQSLTAFVVGATDLTFVAGDIVLLAAQTTAADCGLYVVGTVATTAPLTRLATMPLGMVGQNGCIVEVSEGTIWKGSTWKAMATTTGGFVVGTNDPNFYPRVCKGTLTLSSGTYTLGSTEGLFLLSTTTSPVNLTLNTAGGTVTSTVGLRAAVTSRVAGKSGTGQVIALAIVAAGTINSADNSTVDWLATNW